MKPARTGTRRRELDVVYEDESLVVVNKPAGLLSVPLERNPGVPSVLERLTHRYRSHGKLRPLVVHRIDQDSSGLVVFAKNVRTQRALREQFSRREPERIYQAVVHGHVHPADGTWKDRLIWDTKALIQKVAIQGDRNAEHAEDAISDYRVIEDLKGACLIEVRLRTGRRNQIRIQAALRGHPLVGERRYTAPGVNPKSIHFERQALHAWRLTFRHPHTSRLLTCEAPPPPDFVDLVSRLRSKRRTGERT